MKQLLVSLLLLCLPFAAAAQSEEDFASRFMKLYGEGTSLKCMTVSPVMIERMMQLPSVEENEQAKQVLSQLKTIRVVSGTSPDGAESLYAHARQLAQHNAARYKLHAEEEGKSLYTRRRGGVIVEMVLFMNMEGQFSLINLTGNMTEKFLDQLMNM